MKIAVFCSANEAAVSTYGACTAALGEWMAKEGHTLVYGGCDGGLMGVLGRAVHQAGGRCIGVVPRLVELGSKAATYLDVEIPCDDLTDRKQLMMLQADAFVALPGGLGTLDEVFTVVASSTVGYHHKPIVLYAPDLFWQSTVAMLQDLQQRGMMRGAWQQTLQQAQSLSELAACLR